MLDAVVLTIDERVVLDGVQRPVLVFAETARRKMAVVTAPNMGSALFRQPLLQSDGSETREVFWSGTRTGCSLERPCL